MDDQTKPSDPLTLWEARTEALQYSCRLGAEWIEEVIASRHGGSEPSMTALALVALGLREAAQGVRPAFWHELVSLYGSMANYFGVDSDEARELHLAQAAATVARISQNKLGTQAETFTRAMGQHDWYRHYAYAAGFELDDDDSPPDPGAEISDSRPG